MGHLTPHAGAPARHFRSLRGFALVFAMACAIGLALLPISAATAQDGSSVPKWAYDLAHELMSPYCPGRTLAECPSPQAAELRIWIHTQAAAGATPDEVREMLYDRFGDIVRGAPRPEGWGLSAYLVPIVVFALGGPVVFLIVRRMVRPAAAAPADKPAPAAPPTTATADPELERLLDAELRDL